MAKPYTIFVKKIPKGEEYSVFSTLDNLKAHGFLPDRCLIEVVYDSGMCEDHLVMRAFFEGCVPVSLDPGAKISHEIT